MKFIAEDERPGTCQDSGDARDKHDQIGYRKSALWL